MIEIHPLLDIEEVREGDDLGLILSGALAPLRPGFGGILVVTQKIVSKAEGRIAYLGQVSPSARAMELAAMTQKDPRFVELVLAESSEIVRAVPGILITRHRLGFVMANAGIDCSNVGPEGEDKALLLPADPDASAARLRASIHHRLDVWLGIILSDSFGRPWRNGVVNVALGSAGIPALHDRRGSKDRDGRELRVTQIAYGDLIASAAGLVMGEAAEGIPAAYLSGCDLPVGDIPSAKLLRSLDEDLFR
jgi:coenzyme F420-0:L-glutamate ligase / coenzyme F420-1:gamma-L-glutamate ligase